MSVGSSTLVNQFMLWIDSVGGYWVCLGDELIIGQPGGRNESGGAADIPILADISSRHARIRRDGEGYVIDALRDVRVAGRRVEKTEILSDGSRIEIGPNVRMQLRRTHPLSLSARLDFLSRHRTQPAADAVLLLADSCVMGPRPHSHVVCREWSKEVILFRYEEKMICHAAGRFEIDGVAYRNRGPLHANARVAGEGFSFSLEAVEC